MTNKRRQSFPERDQTLEPWLETLAWLMDRSIPIGRRWNIGLDGLLGLIPGFGDLTGGLVSSLIIARSLQAGLPRSAILRMIANVAVDSFLGSVPLVGDLFDFVWKANSRNVEIYRQALAGETRIVRDWLFSVVVALATIALVLLPIICLIYLARELF